MNDLSRTPKMGNAPHNFALLVGLTASLIAQASCSDDVGWEQESSPTESQLDAIWGTGPSDVWAVGHDGVALHYDGDGWREVSTGTSETLFAVWGASPDRYWAGAIDGNVLVWDGSKWTPDPWFAANNTDIVSSITGSGPNDVWVSTTFKLFHWDGSGWSKVAMPPDELFDNIHSVGPGALWATGDSRNLYRMVDADAGAWELFQVPDVGGVFIWNDISGCSSTDLWAVGGAISASNNASFAYRFDGKSWSGVQMYEDDPSLAPGSLEAVWCQGGEVWTVGLSEAHHFDGSSWEHGSFDDSMLAIWGTTKKELWSVGSLGAIYHRPAP